MRGLIFFFFFFFLICLVFFPDPVNSGILYAGNTVSFVESRLNSPNNGGLFLESNNLEFGFGFITTQPSASQFTLGIIHKSTKTVIWSANKASPVSNLDKLVFEANGSFVLLKGNGRTEVFRFYVSAINASRIELLDSGNLVVVSVEETSIWQSFDYPTDTLITNQVFREGMKLTSSPSSSTEMTYAIEIKSGDVVLSLNSLTPQVYWSAKNDKAKIINNKGGVVTSSSISGNSWRFFDQRQVLLWQFVFPESKDDNATWIAVLGNNGVISFSILGSGVTTVVDSSFRIPSDLCKTPEPCGPYNVCSGKGVCTCVPGLARASPDCKTRITSPCEETMPLQLVDVGYDVNYFALGFAPPLHKKTDLDGCKGFCNNNCSCLGLFFQNSSGNCFLFDWIGSFQNSSNGNSSFVSFIKVSSDGAGGGKNGEGNEKHIPNYVVMIIVVVGVLFIAVTTSVALWILRRKTKTLLVASQESLEELSINLQGAPIRFAYKDLRLATKNFSVMLGRGGFGSVYEGTLPDGSRIAVKRLEAIGQGKKEFRAEVGIIGSIHNVHLVRLKGFCAEGTHRLLAYEFLSKGSLEKWIFRRNNGEVLLDCKTRLKIALGTAKGLEYLHEDCVGKIIHFDIKPENILLDDNFNAKISDFGLAKLIAREESQIFRTLCGTKGYMAPELITNSKITEKVDVYSYGMVLLELIGGRRNYDSSISSEESNFASYAFKKMEEGKLMEIVDGKMNNADVKNEAVERAIRTALWCIQSDFKMRPSMSEVVRMLEGNTPVAQPPRSSTVLSPINEDYGAKVPRSSTDLNSDDYLSAVCLSGPR